MPYPSYNFMNQQPQYQNYFNQPLQQQIQMQPQQNFSNGKIVDSIEMVKFADIPMDGNNYYFPKADGTEIFSKRWLANGSTEINTYAKIDVNQLESDKNTFEDTLMEKLNIIDERIEKLEKGLSKSTRNSSKEA